MASFFSFLTHKKIPSLSTLRALLRGPLTIYRGLVYGFLIAAAASLFLLIVTVHNSFLVTVPSKGGTLTEGVIGAPSMINPLFAVTDTDDALTNLIYAGLMKETADGTVIPEIAQSYTLSPDSRTYTFTLKKIPFSDGTLLTSADVLFTISTLQRLNTPYSSYWADVGVEVPDDHTVVFTLPSPRADFLSHTTFGILPEHVWKDVSDEDIATSALNTHPVGAGAFTLTSIQSADGVASALTLKRNRHYILGAPLLQTVRIRIYDNQTELKDAVEEDDIDYTFALLPETLDTMTPPDDMRISTIPTGTQAALYHLRGDANALSNTGLTTVLDQYIDKQHIIAIVEHGFGETPETGAPTTIEETQEKLETLGYRNQNGALMKNGASVGFSIATTNEPDMVALATTLAGQLRALGIIVSVRNFDPGTFQAALARNSFSAVLLKGVSQPGSYEKVITLYQTGMPFVTKNDAHGIITPVLITPTLRYAAIRDWYVNTDRLYPWLASLHPAE